MKRYQNNMADQELVVGSLRVLNKIEGGPVREIRKTVEAVRKTQNIQNLQQEQNWRALADDGLITPVEKQELLRNSKSIDRSFVAITQQAQAMGIPAESISGYTTAYNQLHSYLYVTLKLFDDMSKGTAIDNRDTFNQYFSSYYYAESYVQLAIAADILDSINFRVLQSLDEEGEEGEIGFYNGGIYQYIDGRWKNLTVGAYKGPRTELPPEEEEAFFIASDNFTVTEGLIVNNDVLYVNNDILGITHTYYKGYIYYFQSGAWLPEWDKRDWKYSAAFADVINITGELPQIFQDSIDVLQGEIDDLQTDLSTSVDTLSAEIATRQGQYTIIGGDRVLIDDLLPQIVEEYNQQQTEIDSKVSHLPVYYGKTMPNNPKEGDFYLYTTSGQHQNQIRRYHNGAWEWLADPEHNDAYRNYYMMALQDILEAEQAGSGYFSALFANAFWANNAVINKLETKTIYLQYGGAIQSANTVYREESAGLRIDYNGNIDANGNTHLRGKVAIGVPLAGNSDFNTYEVVIGGNTFIKNVTIGGNTTISGILSGATGILNSIQIIGDSKFYGEIDSGPLLLTNNSVPGASYHYYTGSRVEWNFYFPTVEGTYGPYTFSKIKVSFEMWRYERNYVYRNEIILYDASGSEIYRKEDRYDPDPGPKLIYDLIFQLVTPGETKTLKLRNLPTVLPSEQGVVYVDSSGYLKIRR